VPPSATRVAIDLSGPLIRVVEGALGGPMRCGSGGTPAGAHVRGRVVDVEAVGSALNQLLARTEILGSRALVSVNDALATFRVLTLPRDSTDQTVAAAVSREMPQDSDRMSIRWVDVPTDEDERRIYAVASDRALVRSVTEAVRVAGLDPAVIDLKSACVARTAPQSVCVIVDLTGDPAEIILIDRNVPQVWHPVHLNLRPGEDVAPALVAPLRSVVRFYKRRRDTSFDSDVPILICSEQPLPAAAAASLADSIGHPVDHLPTPPRVPADIRYATYLTCIGLMMRRKA
jgi:hypothetical protein